MDKTTQFSFQAPAPFISALSCYLLPLALLVKVFLNFFRQTRSHLLVNEDFARFMNEPFLVRLSWPPYLLSALCGLYALVDSQWTLSMWYLYAGSNLLIALFHFYHLYNQPYTSILALFIYAGLTTILHFLMIDISFINDQVSKELLLNLMGCLQAWFLCWFLYICTFFAIGKLNLNGFFASFLSIILGSSILYYLIQSLKEDHVLWSQLIGLISITIIGLFLIFFVSLTLEVMTLKKKRNL